MSNSRNIRRSVKRNATAVGMAALGTVTVGGLLMTTAGTAFASTATTSTLAYAKTGDAATNYMVQPGQNNQAAAPLTVTISNDFSTGDMIALPIEPNGNANGQPGNSGTPAEAVTYSAVPTISVSANTTAETTAGATPPTIKAVLATNPADSGANKNAAIQDELVLTIGNNAVGAAAAGSYTISLSGIHLNVGANAATVGGPNTVDIASSYTSGSTTTASTGSPVGVATIQTYSVTETPTGVQSGATNAALPNFTIAESTAGVLPTGVYSLAATNGKLVPGSTVSLTASGLTIAAAPAAGAGCPTTGGSATLSVTVDTTGAAAFCVVSKTTTSPGSIQASGLTYNAGVTGPDSIILTNTLAANGTTAVGTKYQAPQPAVTVVAVNRVAGFTADDTAAAAALQQYPGGSPVAILASDAEYQDALSASFLGHAPLSGQAIGFTSTTSTNNPILLTTPGALSSAAANALRKLNTNTVYIVGGTAAVSQAVQNSLQSMTVGTSATGQPLTMRVVRIAGVTAEETAKDVAEYPTLSGNLGMLPSTPGAYGMYNSGASESATPPATTSNIKTAIVADANEFQDALAASGLAYGNTIPVLLTPGGQGLDPNAAAAITNLGVKQVIVVGGSAAVSDQAVTDLENLPGVSVLRIAGTTFDATASQLASFELNDMTAPPTTGSQQVDGLNSTAGFPGIGTTTSTSLNVGTSRGDAYQDALSSAQLLGQAATSAGTTIVTNVTPLLLNTGTSTIGPATASFLGSAGSPPAGGFTVYTGVVATPTVSRSIVGNTVFGGTLAQTPSLVQSELNAIAAG